MNGLAICLELLLISLIGISAYTLKMLSLTGVIAALPIGVITLVGGGPEWFLVLLYFLLAGSLLTALRRRLKGEVEGDEGGGRGWHNVVSNGLVPTIACFVNAFAVSSPSKQMLYVFYLGAVASAFSDTAATEVGLLYPRYPRLITRPRTRVPPGTSGGVTPLGFIAGILASMSISVVGIPGAVLLGMSIPRLAIVTAISGFTGSVIDSLMGATVQGRYRCSSCGRVVEKAVHCGAKAEHIGGVKFVDNNIVNLLSSLAGGALALALHASGICPAF